MRYYLALIIFATFSLEPQTFACSCSNNVPIQKSSSRYTSADRAVFTAHVVGLIGRITTQGGKRGSEQALAIVHERYWGLPWYWPKVVLLDGSYPCDIGMFEGEDYLVQGRKAGYGVVMVNLCSRTQPLKTAQLDLRTLDGTHCSAPGGTIIGHVRGEWDSSRREYKPINVASITYRDFNGNVYYSKVDENGIYELQHLPVTLYMPDTHLGNHQHLFFRSWEYEFNPFATIQEGFCQERDLTVQNYQLTGRLLPGIGRTLKVELTDARGGSVEIRADPIQPDGRFYFHDVAPGKYLLSANFTIGHNSSQIFYPGTSDRAKAKQIVIPDDEADHSYDFDPKALPVVPISVVLDPVDGSDRFLWDFQLMDASEVVSTSRSDGTNIAILYGFRGRPYHLRLYGYPHNPQKDAYCISQPVSVRAEGTAPLVHISARCAPRGN